MIPPLTYQNRIILVVVVIFTLMVPPLIYFSIEPLRQQGEELVSRHAQNLQQIAALASGKSDPGRVLTAAEELSREEKERSHNSFRKAERITCLSFLVGGLITALLTTIFALRTLVNPLISLCSQIKGISAAPSKEVKIDVKGGAEFQQISNAFNRHMELLQEKDRQLQHAQQMELAGLLAGGMVHEFNTVLTILRGGAEHLRKKLADDDPLHEITLHMINAVNRGQHLTGALRPFQREGLIEPEPIDMNLLVQEVQEEHEKLIGHSTAIQAAPSIDPLWVQGDRHYLQQVLINVINNARDAMPEGGVIRIRNHRQKIDEELLRGYDWATPGEYAGTSITDSGTGMDEETIDRIFQPFFTTKDIGQGTGLGLTMAYGIIREHKGFITVRSQPEEGTAVTIYLPVIPPPSQRHSSRPIAA